MELFSADIDRVKGLVGDWLKNPEVELEATFGPGGKVDMQTFLRVIQRLKSKGHNLSPQEDRLTVCLDDSTRFTLMGNQVKKYCYDDTMAGKAFVAIIKDRNISRDVETKSNIDLKDYDVRIKARREKPFTAEDPQIKTKLESWTKQKKYFRLIRRWTAHSNGLIIDISMVRNSRSSTLTFQEANILRQPPVYEIEVELERPDKTDGLVDTYYTKIIQGIGEILRGIQGNTILIRNSVKTKVLEDYRDLTKLDVFRGVAPVTLGVRHMVAERTQPNIRDGYNVTDKADGLRVHGFTDKKGELFMIDMSMNVYKTGLSKEACKGVLLDGEYVTKDKEGKGIQSLLFFDIYYMDGKDVSQQPFLNGRYDNMRAWINSWSSDEGPRKQLKTSSLQVSLKSFLFAKGDDIFEKASSVLGNDSIRNYYTDGLIFTPNDLKLPARPGGFIEQYKWKPSKDNSVDFLVKMEKDLEMTKEDAITVGIHPDTHEEIRYKTLRLLVSSRDQQSSRDIILNKLPIEQSKYGKARPVLFTPSEYPDLMASVCYLETDVDSETGEEFVKTEEDEPIRDKSIIEMRYDGTKSPGWRWVPMRIRTDKTERFAKGILQKTMNSSMTADDIWLSYHEPVTKHMIQTGAEEPTKAERDEMAVPQEAIKKKYREKEVDKKDKAIVQTMLDFHNKYIKTQLLYGAVMGRTKKLLDMTVGEASDLNKWIEGGVEFVLGVDLAGDSILNEQKGAYNRLLRRWEENQRLRTPKAIPTIFFVIGNSSLRLMDGSAGSTEQDKDMLRSIFGYPTTGPVPALVSEKGAGELKSGADTITCMYALHYFFETEAIFDGFLQNLNDNLKVGGYFIGTNFDGKAVFDLLRDTKQGESRSGIDKSSVVWELTKQYSEEELPIDSSAFGMAVDVKFITIGMTQREYLVPWELLVRKMKTIGCELVEKAELATMGLANSTNMYEASYDMVQKSKDKARFTITSAAAKQFSFLNRWYIFKRVSKSGEIEVEIEEPEGVASVPEELAPTPTQPQGPTNERVLETLIQSPEAITIAQTPAVLLKTTYTPNEIYQFKENSPETDKKSLDVPEKYKKYAARWMAPNAPFPITDVDSTIYPSISHFLAGMKFKYASKTPEKATTLFSRDGAIHQKFLQQRLAQKKLTVDKHYELLLEEDKELDSESKKELRKNATQFNQAAWDTAFDDLLKGAIQQRLKSDKWFCILVNAIVTSGKYLLYQDSKTSILGGVRTVSGTIEGQNKYGKFILELATSSPDLVKACAETGSEPPV